MRNRAFIANFVLEKMQWMHVDFFYIATWDFTARADSQGGAVVVGMAGKLKDDHATSSFQQLPCDCHILMMWTT